MRTVIVYERFTVTGENSVQERATSAGPSSLPNTGPPVTTASRGRPKIVSLLIGVTLALLATACGSEGSSSEQRTGTTVIATTGVIADIVQNVAGPDAQVVQLIPDGVDVHSFEVSAQVRQSLNEAALVIEAGARLEAGLPLAESEAQRWALADAGGELLELPSGALDPHVWMSPAFVSDALGSLADALSHANPENAAAYRTRAAEYAERLKALDGEIAAEISQIPKAQRSLVTSHDSLGYFADRYGLEVLLTPFPSSGPEAEPSAARLAEVQAAIERSGVSALFAQASDSADVLETLARATGTEVVDDLLVGSPGDAGGYEEMLRHDAMLISSALR
jgi:manganese/iron transport system substrate-binding protein